MRSASTTTPRRDLGLDRRSRSARRVRPCSAATPSTYWLGPDGENYEVNVQLPQGQPRALAADLGNLYLSHEQARPRRRAADGAAAAGRRDRRDDEPADHQAPGPAAPRGALRRRRGPPVAATSATTCRRSSRTTTLPPGYRFDVGGQTKDMEESFSAALARAGAGGRSSSTSCWRRSSAASCSRSRSWPRCRWR